MNIHCYSLSHLQFLRASDAKLAQVTSKMASRFSAVTKGSSQIIKQQAVVEIHEEGGRNQLGGSNR